MDEINYKLKTNNSVLVVNAIEKLITAVKTKYKPADRQRFILENEELKFLREKCSSKDTVVSLTACQGLLALVESGVLEIGHTMSTVITLLPMAHNFSAIISTIAGLLILDLKCRLVPGQAYTCQFSLKSPQHPFITVLEKNSDATEDVITQMHALCTHPDYIVSSNSSEMLLPVFLWMSCRPRRGGSGEARVWQLLLNINNSSRPDLLLDCLTWQQFGDQKQASSTFAAISAVTETKLYQQQREFVIALLPLLASLSNEIIKHGGDPRTSYHLMDRCLIAGVGEATLTLSLLADTLPSLCALHLQQMMHTCLNIITRYEYASIALSMFVAQFLQWLHLPSTLTTNALKITAKILDTYRSQTKDDTTLIMPNLYANKTFQTFLYTNKAISIKFRLFKTWELIRDNPTKLRCWFDNIEKVDDVVHLEMVTFLIGVFIEKRKEEVFEEFALRALKIVVKLIDVKKDLAVQLVPILLYKIANDSSPVMKLECLKVLPLMAKTKENVPTIVSILNKLKSSKSVPLSTLIMLHSTLTEVQVRCFPYLQELLMDGATRPHDVKWEIEIAKALAVKKVCETKPSLGLELVAAISSLLNRCTDDGGVVPSCAALGALSPLWREGLVAPGSTWTALAPRMEREKRPAVLNSYFELLSSLPLPASSPVWLQCAAAAWRRVGSEHAACTLLARACTSSVPLRVVPEIYRRTVKLPSSYCKTPEDAARNPEDVLEYIPSEVWPEVFKYTSSEGLPAVRELAGKLIENELRGYRSGVYQPDTRGEPQSMAYLPPHSVLRGLADYLRKQASSRTYDCPDSVLLEILWTLAKEYPKPLPPLELWWVQPLLHLGAQWRRAGLELAARQAHTSGSATRLFDNFLLSLCGEGCQESDIIILFELLPIAAKNMLPNSLKKPLEKCLTDSFHQIADTKIDEVSPLHLEDILFVRQMELVRECLLNEKIHDANRTLLSQMVENFWLKVSEDNVAWASFISCCTALPTSQLERMTSPLSWWEWEGRVFRASCSMRCQLARGTLVWINEIVDAAATHFTEQEYTLQRMFPVLQNASASDETRDWLLQLMARTQVAFAEMEDENAKSFLWDVFVLSVVTISGHWSFEPDVARLPTDRQLRYSLFPAALASLFDRPSWKEYAPRVLECVIKCSWSRGATFASVCRHAAAALRGHADARLWALAVRGNT